MFGLEAFGESPIYAAIPQVCLTMFTTTLGPIVFVSPPQPPQVLKSRFVLLGVAVTAVFAVVVSAKFLSNFRGGGTVADLRVLTIVEATSQHGIHKCTSLLACSVHVCCV